MGNESKAVEAKMALGQPRELARLPFLTGVLGDGSGPAKSDAYADHSPDADLDPAQARAALDAASEKLMRETDAQWNALSSAEQSAIKNYTGGTFVAVNKALGSNDGDAKKAEAWATKNGYPAGEVKGAAAAVNSGSLPENTVLYRATNLKLSGVRPADSKPWEKGFGKDSTPDQLRELVGKTFQENVIGSSSIKYDTAKGFQAHDNDRVVMRIRAPQGTKGMYLAGDRSNTYLEKEFAFAPKTSYTVRGVSRRKNGDVVLDVDATSP